MKKPTSTAVSILLTALALAGAAAGVWCLPESSADAPAPVQVAQSTSAILEGRAA